jgi:uncharacterized repeat protein (TIGR03803 family)
MNRKSNLSPPATMSRTSVVSIIALLAGAASPGLAQYKLTTLANVYGGTSLTVVGSTLYGADGGGGANGDGMVFSLPITGGAPTILASFNGNNGDIPNASLVVSGRTLYGTTQNGGASVYGTVFSLPITGGAPTVLASFNEYNGASPNGPMVLSGGTLYGTSTNGGVYGGGAVFSVPVTGGTPTVLASFDGSSGRR